MNNHVAKYRLLFLLTMIIECFERNILSTDCLDFAKYVLYNYLGKIYLAKYLLYIYITIFLWKSSRHASEIRNQIHVLLIPSKMASEHQRFSNTRIWAKYSC